MNANHHRIAFIPIVLALAACGNEDSKVSLGDDKGTVAQGLAAYEGAWDGYAEAREFPGGSDRVRITLDDEGNGTIQFGDIASIAPFGDPTIGYPTEWDYEDPNYPLYGHSAVQSGFGYPILDAAVSSGRLTFEFWPTDLVKDWCEAQTPLLDDSTPARWGCSPTGFNATVGPACNEGNPSYDCGQIFTCMMACDCDASGCTSVRQATNRLQLDGAITDDGDTLEATVILPLADHDFLGSGETERVTVRLTR